MPKLADSLKTVLLQRQTLATDIGRWLDDHPLFQGPDPDARHRSQDRSPHPAEVGDGSAFASSGHLAAYVGIAPVTHRSGRSIKGQHPARSGNHKLKRAFFLSAYIAQHDPASRAYCDRKRGQRARNTTPRSSARRRYVIDATLKPKSPTTTRCNDQP